MFDNYVGIILIVKEMLQVIFQARGDFSKSIFIALNNPFSEYIVNSATDVNAVDRWWKVFKTCKS